MKIPQDWSNMAKSWTLVDKASSRILNMLKLPNKIESKCIRQGSSGHDTPFIEKTEGNKKTFFTWYVSFVNPGTAFVRFQSDVEKSIQVLLPFFFF